MTTVDVGELLLAALTPARQADALELIAALEAGHETLSFAELGAALNARLAAVDDQGRELVELLAATVTLANAVLGAFATWTGDTRAELIDMVETGCTNVRAPLFLA